MLVTLCKVSELYFRFLGTNGFHAKVENERFNVAVSRCRQNPKYENSTLPFDRLRQKIAPNACRTCSTIIFPRSSNQIIDFWRCRCCCSRRFLNSLKMWTQKQGARTQREEMAHARGVQRKEVKDTCGAWKKKTKTKTWEKQVRDLPRQRGYNAHAERAKMKIESLSKR